MTETKDPLKTFEALSRDEALTKSVAMLLWKDRYRNPDMAVQVSAADLESFTKCTDYLSVEATVRIHRPQGRAAQEAMPATAKRSAQPAIPAESPRPYILIQLTDKDGNSFVPIESTEDGAVLRDAANAQRTMKHRAPEIAAQLMSDLSGGAYSDATIREAAQMLMGLAKA